jgi:hypothetical protein
VNPTPWRVRQQVFTTNISRDWGNIDADTHRIPLRNKWKQLLSGTATDV